MISYIRYDDKTKEIVISGLATARLMNRIDEHYKSASGYGQVKGSSIKNIFNSVEYITWDKAEIRIHSFFALEFYQLMCDLCEEYKDTKYGDVADELYRETWISNYANKDKVKMDLTPLTKFTIKPKDFQLEFIKEYPSLKYAYDLDGYILSFEQGLGKTFTAIAIGECLRKEAYYIVCPNQTKENWANEIKKYFKIYENDEKLWKSEVCIVGSKKFKPTANSKFYIINQESVPNIFPFVDSKKDNMIIIDESHNFRGSEAKRVAAMLKLKELAKCTDCLLMSGTPLKAMAGELVPSLRMIDPHFTEKLANIYYKAFNTTSAEAANIIRARFSRCIYRKAKKDIDEIQLPEKFISDIRMKIPKEREYAIEIVRKVMAVAFHDEYLRRLKSGLFTTNKQSPFYRSRANDYDFLLEQTKFEKVVRQYSRAHSEITENYLNYIFQRTEDSHFDLITAQNVENKFFSFLLKYVVPFVRTKEEKEIVTTRFNGILGWAIAAKGASATIIGTYLAKYKNNCFINIWRYNYKEFLNMINTAKKKTIIFTALVPTAHYIAEDLSKRGIGIIEITGETASKMSLVEKFKTDDSIRVMVATTQTMEHGLTLTEANQIIFFGTPYRSTDFEQACDRIHRIGQDANCYIYNVLLWSHEKNITDRIEEIMNWSEEQFSALITESVYE